LCYSFCMKSLREVVQEHKAKGAAVGHFNISDSNQLRAIAMAAKETGLPAIVGLSEGERDYFPMTHARGLVTMYQAEGVPLYLNADHTYDVAKAKKAIDDGVDSIVVDGAKLPMEENIRMVKEVVTYARSSKRDVLVEGELGYIGTSSKQLDALPEGVSLENLTTPADAKELVGSTGIDCFAPAVGNIHGMLKNAAEPRLHPERVKEIADAVGVALVLHGASGNTEEDVKACIKAGMAIVHINTELRVLYRDHLYDTIRSNPGEAAPYKFLAPSVEKMKEYVAGKLKVFAGQ
jgi:fructose-bisphosphate aldolase, class II